MKYLRLLTLVLALAATGALSSLTITHLEYFFDADPGQGNGTPIYGNRDTLSLDEAINVSSLSPGIHRLFVRSQDNLGNCSLPQRESFFIKDIAEPGTMVSSLEYFIDADPGFGNGTQVELTSANPISADISIAVGQISHGNHCLYLRAKNSEGGWGFPASCQFSDGIPAQVTISVIDGTLTISWEDLYGIDTYKVYSAPLPEADFAEEDGGSFGASNWIAPASHPERFYQVKSVYGE